jgi:hypothetical protein
MFNLCSAHRLEIVYTQKLDASRHAANKKAPASSAGAFLFHVKQF